MTKEHFEQGSIILEMMAFFFVTVDLYGKHRIAKLETRLRSLNIFMAISKLVDWLSPEIKLKYKILILITGLILWDTTLIANNYHWPVHDEPLSVSYVIWSSLAFFSVLIMLGFLAMVGVLILIVLTSIALLVIKTFTKLFPIEGMMLTLGAALFIASKSLGYYCIVLFGSK